MSDFAKTFFGFGKQRSNNPEIGQVGQQPLHQQLDAPLTRVASPSGFPSEMLPHTATPTIGLSENSFAMGTTIKGELNALNKSINQFDQTQQSNLTAQLSTNNLNNLVNSQNSAINNNNGNSNINSNNTSTKNTNNNQTTIKNPDYNITNAMLLNETGTAVPRGKLRISIIEASNLNIHTNYAQPYVVCTFENSEVVTHGPESFDNKNNKSTIRAQSTSHQNSQHNNDSNNRYSNNKNTSNPIWHHTAIFDVIGAKSELKIFVYDTTQADSFLGQVTISPKTIEDSRAERWFDLQQRLPSEPVTGKIRVKLEYSEINKRHYGPEDFEILRLLGKGTFGQVFQVKKEDTKRVYAMKVLSKKVIVRKKEIAHTIGERNILVRTATTESPFIVGLKFSFQTPTDLYLVTDFMSGGELFWHLQKEGRFSEDRAKFYIAELVLALEHLHDNDIVYRDLKPENILLDANGHIALCDFGLSKANLTGNGTTNTFCGTTEYLAPEVLLDESGYTKMVDFWSLGVLIFEMCCGWSPFYAENTQQMYKNIAFGKVRFPKEVLSAEGRSFVKGLLNRNPKHRLGAFNDARELRAHPFFQDVDWPNLKQKKIPPPFVPHIANELDTSNFDPEFTNTSTSAINKQLLMGTTPLSQAVQENFKGFTYVDDSTMFDHFNSSVGRRGSYKPQYGSFIPGNPNLPPDEEVIDEESEIEEEIEDDMDVDDEFVNGQFDL